MRNIEYKTNYSSTGNSVTLDHRLFKINSNTQSARVNKNIYEHHRWWWRINTSSSGNLTNERAGLLCSAFILLPEPVSSLVLVLPLISHTLVPERSQASWMESQKLILCLRIPHGQQIKQMDGSRCKWAENWDNRRHSGFINIFGEILVENSDIKQSLGNNIYTSTDQDSILILPQKI